MPLRKGYKRKKLVKSWRRYCTPGSIRTVKSGKAYVLVCRPRGKKKMRAISIDVQARKEKREHPWASMKTARRIAADHLRRGFGEMSGMKVKKSSDFIESGEWIVSYRGQTFRIYYDRSIFPVWTLAFAPGKRSQRHGDDVLSIGDKSEALDKLRAMIDANDPRLTSFQRR